MELQLATLEDIANELLSRQIRFAFVAIEDSNTPRTEFACFSGKGDNQRDVSDLFQCGRDVFGPGSGETGDTGPMDD